MTRARKTTRSAFIRDVLEDEIRHSDSYTRKPVASGEFGASPVTHAAPKLMIVKERNHQLRFASHLELVAHANRRVDIGRVDVAARQTVVHPAVHRADVGVEVRIESVVGVEGKGLEASTAGGVRGCGATCLRSCAEGILMNAVVGRGEVEVVNDGVANARPIDPHSFWIWEASVAYKSQDVTTDVAEPGTQGAVRIGILDVLVPGKKFQRVELV